MLATTLIRSKSTTVLMVDDNADDRLFAMEAWKNVPLSKEIRFVQDGEELMDYLHHRGQYCQPKDAPCPGLIFLDLNMPHKSGFDVLQEIRTNPTLRTIPIVVLTDSMAAQDMRRADDLGATLFLHKPITLSGYQELITAIRNSCRTLTDHLDVNVNAGTMSCSKGA